MLWSRGRSTTLHNNITSFFNTAVAINKVPPDIAMQSISEIQLIVVFTLHFQNLLHEPVVVYVLSSSKSP